MKYRVMLEFEVDNEVPEAEVRQAIHDACFEFAEPHRGEFLTAEGDRIEFNGLIDFSKE